MKCSLCENMATVHLTDILAKQKRELHLCEHCARAHHLISGPHEELDVESLLELLTNQSGVKISTETAPTCCPHCGMQYAQFRVQGRFGCPEDYEVFRHEIEPLLERIHRSVRHTGKIPRKNKKLATRVRSQDLRSKLLDAVAHERYEDAAIYRDELQRLGDTDES